MVNLPTCAVCGRNAMVLLWIEYRSNKHKMGQHECVPCARKYDRPTGVPTSEEKVRRRRGRVTAEELRRAGQLDLADSLE